VPRLATGALLIGLLLPFAAHAAPEKTVATVNGIEIKEGLVPLAAQIISQQASVTPDKIQRSDVIDYLIQMYVVADAAFEEKVSTLDLRKQDLASGAPAAGDPVTSDVNIQRLQALGTLVGEYYKKTIRSTISDQETKGMYDNWVSKFTPGEEVRAHHILVKTEDEAKDIAKKLKDGGSFTDLAKQYSQDPGGQTGGDLGYFGRGDMVKPFEDAAFALETGKISDPVQSQFGWHIIQVDDKRQSKPPAFEDVKESLVDFAGQSKLAQRLAVLKEKAQIQKFE
jgi:peptidyl-prolyl cis-trans isomerase C